MGFLAAQYLVSTAPTLIANTSGPFTLTLSVVTGGTVYLGNSTGVNSSNGCHVIAGAPFTTQGYVTGSPAALYAVSGSGTVGLGVLLSTPR